MSSKEDVELKAGHPPAVKAGGKRVARTHHSSGGEPAPKPDDPEQQEYADPAPKDEGAAVLVSGAVVKGDQAFPPEAVKHYHEKPVPSKVNRQPGHSPHQQVNQHINQPR